MLASTLFGFLLFFGALVVAQDTPSVVCIAGQCVQGFTNLSLGTTLSASGSTTDLHLLPGQYTESTDPQLLHSLLTSSSATISSSAGFPNDSSVSLPLSVQLQPGFAFYSSANYSGAANYVPLPTSANASNVTTPFNGGSFVLSSDTWAELSSSNGRIILWDASPDVSQLPGSFAGLSLSQLQSSSCSSACASGGVCTSQGSCACLSGFQGSSCEACQTGFFGPSCQPCPANCETCDDGINGSGVCLKTTSETQNCNCLNGQCASDGSCVCNAGWVDNSNGTKCASCASGFFLSDDRSCKVCELGCATCADSTGTCTACKSGFTLSSTDSTKCNPPSTSTNTGTVCPDGSFSNGTACSTCNSLCSTCSGPTANDCIVCGSGRYQFNGTCVSVDGSGVCQTGLTSGNGFVADNNKKECEACPEKCTACGIDSFSIASTIDQVKCTACLPGSVLSNGQCVENCPSETFLDPRDNLTCTTCDSSCSTCANSANFCLTCSNNLLASSGSCVSSCPSGTFSSSGACLPCHPDCSTCSGGSFNQCSACPSSRPILSNGRCLPTCAKNQFFDTSSGDGQCNSCDSSCASCSGAGSSNCLSCADGGNVLRDGKCVPATCSSSTNVVSGLGACLSDLVAIPQVSGSGTASVPLPTITGIDTPTQPSSGGSSLEWWEIFLMALGCAFILLCVALCWRRRARKKRAQQTREFARAKKLDDGLTWKERVVRFGEKLFGHTIGERVLGTRKPGTGPIALQDVGPVDDKRSESFRMRERDLEEARYERDVDKLLDGYAYSRPQTLNTYDERSRYLARVHADASVRSHSSKSKYSKSHRKERARELDRDVDLNTMSDESIYTYLTGQPRRAADVRQPVRSGATPIPTTTLDLDARDLERVRRPYLLERDRARGRGLESRFSVSSYSDSSYRSRSLLDRQRSPGSRSNGSSSRAPTPAQEYALSVADRELKRGRSPLSREHRSPSHRLIDLDDPAEEYGRGAGTGGGRGEYWLRPTYTGNTNSSGGSKNPFRR